MHMIWILCRRWLHVLGKKDDADKFRTLYEKRKELFNKTFVNAEKKTLGLIGGGRGFGGQAATPAEFKVADTQTSYAVGLAMDLFDDENKPYMIKNLAAAIERENKDDGGVLRPKNSLMTGFIGTAWISKALSDNGHSDLAYRILQNKHTRRGSILLNRGQHLYGSDLTGILLKRALVAITV